MRRGVRHRNNRPAQHFSRNRTRNKRENWLNVRGDDLLDIFNRIENPTATRFIQLKHVADSDNCLGVTGPCEEICLTTQKTTSKRNLKERCRLSRIRDNVSSLLRH